tara:strand:+ start:157 stop:288 length:132 start_codon:yes stop_codon:yes gene_type:complete
MQHFDLGLINKTFKHYYNTKAFITIEKIIEDGTEVRFIINKNL